MRSTQACDSVARPGSVPRRHRPAVAVPDGHAGFVQPRSARRPARDHDRERARSDRPGYGRGARQQRTPTRRRSRSSPDVDRPARVCRLTSSSEVELPPSAERRPRLRVVALMSEPRIRVSAILRWRDRSAVPARETGQEACSPAGSQLGRELSRAHRELAEEIGAVGAPGRCPWRARSRSWSRSRPSELRAKHVVHIVFAARSTARSRGRPQDDAVRGHRLFDVGELTRRSPAIQRFLQRWRRRGRHPAASVPWRRLGRAGPVPAAPRPAAQLPRARRGAGRGRQGLRPSRARARARAANRRAMGCAGAAARGGTS